MSLAKFFNSGSHRKLLRLGGRVEVHSADGRAKKMLILRFWYEGSDLMHGGKLANILRRKISKLRTF